MGHGKEHNYGCILEVSWLRTLVGSSFTPLIIIQNSLPLCRILLISTHRCIVRKFVCCNVCENVRGVDENVRGVCENVRGVCENARGMCGPCGSVRECAGSVRGRAGTKPTAQKTVRGMCVVGHNIYMSLINKHFLHALHMF
jgi:hypothetical protein